MRYLFLGDIDEKPCKHVGPLGPYMLSMSTCRNFGPRNRVTLNSFPVRSQKDIQKKIDQVDRTATETLS